MTKAKTEAQKRRDKKAGRAQQDNGMPELAPVPRAKLRGSPRMTEIKQQSGADVTALEARAKRAGIDLVTVDMSALPDDEDKRKQARKERHVARMARGRQLRDLRAPWYGCEAGLAMITVVKGEGDRQYLWSAICHMRRAQAAYDAAIGAPRRHAECLRLLLPLEEMHTDASSPPIDTRTEVEKRNEAVSVWIRIQGWLANAKDVAGHCKAVVIDDAPCKDPAGMVHALYCVVDGMKGRKMVTRPLDRLTAKV